MSVNLKTGSAGAPKIVPTRDKAMESIAAIIVHLFEEFGCDLRENRKYLFKALHILPFICHIRALWLVNVVASANQWVVFVLHHVIRSVSNGINVVSPTKLPVLFHFTKDLILRIFHWFTIKIRPKMFPTSRSCSINYHVAGVLYLFTVYRFSHSDCLQQVCSFA